MVLIIIMISIDGLGDMGVVMFVVVVVCLFTFSNLVHLSVCFFFLWMVMVLIMCVVMLWLCVAVGGGGLLSVCCCCWLDCWVLLLFMFGFAVAYCVDGVVDVLVLPSCCCSCYSC